MDIKVDSGAFFVFDLDDTLFKEIDFLRSAYRNISRTVFEKTGQDIYDEMFTRYKNGEDVFGWLLSRFGNDIPDMKLEHLLREYREHFPEIELSEETRDFLLQLSERNAGLGIITDGRSITQRNKLRALGIIDIFKDILISEETGFSKPAPENYLYFEKKYPQRKFFYIADNTGKDFIIPGKLGWTSICIKDAGENIHSQDFDLLPNPHYIVSSFKEINLI